MNIVSDCFDCDPEVYRVLIEKMLAGMAPPAMTAAELSEAIA